MSLASDHHDYMVTVIREGRFTRFFSFKVDANRQAQAIRLAGFDAKVIRRKGPTTTWSFKGHYYEVRVSR